MKKYLCLIAVFFFSCTSEIESADSILQKFLDASLNEESSSSYENDRSNSSQGYTSSPGGSTNTSSNSLNRSSSSGSVNSSSGATGNSNHSSSGTTIISPNSGPVSYYGRLKASGKYIVGSRTGTPVQVRGVSLFWSNTGWGGEKFFTASAINALVDDWKAEIIRVPMGHGIIGQAGYDGGYTLDYDGNMARVTTAIDAAIAKDVYVIIDWHSHSAHRDVPSATEFFTAMAEKYGGKDHVIFEIYNEPLCSNGEVNWCPNISQSWTSWAEIKAYADEIIPVIRTNGGASSLILVGTPIYSQKPDDATANPLSDNNVGYVFHFYAATHQVSGSKAYAPPNWNTTYSDGIRKALNANKPVFVTEYGTTNADGGAEDGYDNDGKPENHYNTHNASASDDWHNFMDNNKISSCAWNVGDKKEGSAFFGTGSTFNMSGWTNTSSMTASGQYIYNKLRTYANSAPWR